MGEESGPGLPGYVSQPPGPGDGTGHGQTGYGTAGYGTAGYGETAYGTPAYGGTGFWTAGYGGTGYGPPRRPRRRLSVLTHLLVAVLAAGLGCGATLAFYHPAAVSPQALPVGGGVVPAPASLPARGGPAAGDSVQRIVNKVVPGLVIINTALQYSSQAAAGTGMVISRDGLVLTNNHVIEGATRMSATVVATGKTYPATVIGYDKTGDIALIRLQGAAGLRPVPIGNSAGVKTGARVVAMGNAGGQGTIIPAGGRVTALGKTITASDQGGSAATETLHGMIQTNAGIVSGDSGGPLASAAGQVIGMDTAGSNVSFSQQARAAGFAIPINTALSVARQIAAGHASQVITVGYPPFMGIFIGSGTAASPQAQAQQQQGSGFGGFGGSGGTAPAPRCSASNAGLALPARIAPVGSGTLVDGAICGSPAAAAGMTGGSVITAVNGQPVGSPASLARIMARQRPGGTVSVTWVSPAGKRTTSSLRLLAGPPQ